MAVKELNEIYGEVGRNLDNQMDENVLIPGETGTKTFGAFKFFSGIAKFFAGSAKKIIKGGASVEGGLAVDSLTVNDSGFANSVFAKLIQNAIDIPSGTDFNTLTVSGVYVSHDKWQDQYTNGAPNENYFMLVFNNTDRVITQIALCGNQSILSYRSKLIDQTVWTNWKVI